MRFGNFEVSTHVLGYFRLDGGAMFGSVPKNLWSKKIAADTENCIRLATRSLIIRTKDRVFLVDVGMGEKWSEKSRQIFGIENRQERLWGFESSEVTDIILTHLHFDHAGGISRYKNAQAGELELCFPQARVFLQAENLQNAKNPSLKERASYLKENYEPLSQAKLELLQGSCEIIPDLWVHRVDGHTRGQQVIELKEQRRSLIFATDLIPTAHHLPLPFQMGYDACAETVIKEKEALLSKVVSSDSIIVFEHDAEVAAGTVAVDERGHFALKEIVRF